MAIDEQLAAVRAGLDRVDPLRARAEVRAGARLVDTRPEFQRAADGAIPGALVIERNHLEWRLDPASGASVPEATGTGVRWIVFCVRKWKTLCHRRELCLRQVRRRSEMYALRQRYPRWRRDEQGLRRLMWQVQRRAM